MEKTYISYTGPNNILDMFNHIVLDGFRCKSPSNSPIRKKPDSPTFRKREVKLSPEERFGEKSHYTRIADKNARELIKQEEQSKIKAKKKKDKKEKQKKTKQCVDNENVVDDNNTQSEELDNISNNMGKSDMKTDNREEDGLDINAAFVKSVTKIKPRSTITVKDSCSPINDTPIKNCTLRSDSEIEERKNLKEAAQRVSEAINMSPNNKELILKRSLIYFRLTRYYKSIRDVEKVLQLSPNNTEAYYRLGECHFALKNYTEADAAYTKLATLNAFTDEIQNRITFIRIKQLEEMGFKAEDAEKALMKSKQKSLDEVLEILTLEEEQSEDDDDGDDSDDVYYSDDSEDDEEEEIVVPVKKVDVAKERDLKPNVLPVIKKIASAPTPSKTISITKSSPLLVDSSNPLHCCSLFVGNLKEDITYIEVETVFIKFGDIKSIKLNTTPTCYAFINYEDYSSAGRAMEALQGTRWLLSRLPLLIRYPTNVIIRCIEERKTPEILKTLNEIQPPQSSNLEAKKCPSEDNGRVKRKPEDCFYWCTSGCAYGDKCFNLHRGSLKGLGAPSSLAKGDSK